MSFSVIHCNGCGSRGMFFVTITLDYQITNCPCCHDIKEQKRSYYFCTADCMSKWLDYHKVAEAGFPCPACMDHSKGISTGFAFGFESNGPCRVCKGTAKLKESVKKDVEFDAERMAIQMAFTKEIEAAGGYDAYLKKTAPERKAKSKKKQ
jgi:hypothetical protein